MVNKEVEEYDSFFKRIMGAQGYSGIYIQKGEDHKRDGVAIFYKPKLAEFLDEEFIALNDRGHPESTRGGQRLKCDSVAILAAFKISKPFNHIVIIANAHLKSGEPDLWGDVRLAQTDTLMLFLAFFWRRVSGIYECNPSVILAGDFNSNPSSEVYGYLNSKTIALTMSPFGEDHDKENQADFKLRSVYGLTKREPRFTKYAPGSAETMDYVFFKPSEFTSPVKLLELPEVVDFLPSEGHPSDHLPIGVEFEIKQSKTTK
ncbi:DNAse I-like superfamily protein [Raphanus sativus]|nr:DNAse I-like superfamily protein [Raphanus sativus]